MHRDTNFELLVPKKLEIKIFMKRMLCKLPLHMDMVVLSCYHDTLSDQSKLSFEIFCYHLCKMLKFTPFLVLNSL